MEDNSDEEEYEYEDDDDNYQYDSGDGMESEEEYVYSSGDDTEMQDARPSGARGVKAGANEEIRLLEMADLNPMLEREVKDVNSVIQLPRVATAALLRQHEWNKERLFDKYYSDSTKVVQDAGVDMWESCDDLSPKAASKGEGKEGGFESKEGSGETKDGDPAGGVWKCVSACSFGKVKLPVPAAGSEIECQICVEDFGPNEVVAAPCGHYFCKDCYGDYLTQKARDGPDVVFTKCPESKCNCLIPPQMFEALITRDEIKQKYQKYMVHSYVDRNKSMRWCPAPNCQFIVSAPVGTLNVKCVGRTTACGCSFCFKCGEEAHQPSSCHELSMWSEKCQNDSETANWILANTKRCPKCNTRIEKNQGCNHMTCRACKYEFCWICMGPWSEHGANTGGYYKCNKYDASSPNTDEDTASSAKRELDRYLHYYQRYHAHAVGQKFAAQQREKTERRMVELQESSTNMTWIDVQFLREAMEMLTECRRVLKFTYVFGFYLPPDLQKKDLFEHHQENLEKYTEQLSELTELDVEEMQKQRTDIINYTRVTARFMNQMLLAVEEGLEGSMEDAKTMSLDVAMAKDDGEEGKADEDKAGAKGKSGANSNAGGNSNGGGMSFMGRITRNRGKSSGN